MDKSLRTCLAAGIRLLTLCLVLALTAAIFQHDVHTERPGHFFDEQSLTERSQLVALALSGILFAAGAWHNRKRYVPAVALCGMAALAFVRELDFAFDRIVHGFWWMVPAPLVGLAVGASLWRRRKELFRAFAFEVTQPYWAALCAGFGMVAVFSRLFGMRHNWVTILAPAAVSPTLMRGVRRLAEEGTELAGYAFILVAALEFYLSCRYKERTLPPP